MAGLLAGACTESPAGPGNDPEQSHVHLQPATHVDCDTPADIRAAIDALEADGTLNPGRATALRAKLEQVERWEMRGRPDKAAEAYEALINQLEGWVTDGALAEGDIADLLHCAEDLVAPTIDGIKTLGEWDLATPVATFPGATFYYRNDSQNLYLAFEVVDDDLGADDRFEIRFDNTLDGASTAGDDELTAGLFGLVDRHYSGIVRTWGIRDAQQDGAGAVGANAGVNFFEISHPLHSGDANDFALDRGDSVGWCLRYFADGPTSDVTTFPTGVVGMSCASAFFEQTLYAILTID